MGPAGDRMALCVARGIYMAMCRKKSGMSDRPQRCELRARTPVGLANCKASRPQDSNRSVRSEIPATSKPSTSRRDVAALSFTHMLANLPGQSTVRTKVSAHWASYRLLRRILGIVSGRCTWNRSTVNASYGNQTPPMPPSPPWPSATPYLFSWLHLHVTRD